MPPSDERKTTVVIVESRDNMSCVSENEPKQTVPMPVLILFMLCFCALSSHFCFYSAATRTRPLGRKLTNRNANKEQKKATFFHKLANNVEGSRQYI